MRNGNGGRPPPSPLTARGAPLVSGGELKRGGKWDNLDLGVPGKCDQVIEREGYALGYVEAWEQPAWVSYRLTKDEVMTRKANRESAFPEAIKVQRKHKDLMSEAI